MHSILHEITRTIGGLNQRYLHRPAKKRGETDSNSDREKYKMEIRLHGELERHIATYSVYGAGGLKPGSRLEILAGGFYKI